MYNKTTVASLLAAQVKQGPLAEGLVSLQQHAASATQEDIATGGVLSKACAVENVRRATEIDFTKLHCTKTGQPVGTMAEEQIEMLLALHSVSKLSELAGAIDLATVISPAWVHLGPDELERLEALDPRGFFAYCCNLATQNHHYTFTAKGRKHFATIEKQRVFRSSLVKCWYATAILSGAELQEANKVLRKFIYLNLHNSQFYRLAWQEVRGEFAYDPDDSPILPEEMATPAGISWITKQLAMAVSAMQGRKAYDTARFNKLRNVPLAAIMKKAAWSGAIERDIMFMLSDIDIGIPLTLSEVKARAEGINAGMAIEKQATKVKAAPATTLSKERALKFSVTLDLSELDFESAAPVAKKPVQPAQGTGTEGNNNAPMIKFQPLKF